MGLEAVPAATDGFVSAVRAPVQRKKMADPAVFAKRRARASSFRTRQALWRRFVRSHGTSTGIFAVVCIVAAGLIAGYVHNRSLEITTQGLTGFETVETFYTGLQNADVMSVHNSATGEADKTFSDTIASIYVTNKSRASYDQKSDTKPLEEWLFFHNDFHFWLYGLTHFSINGTSASLHFSAPQKYMRPEPVNAAEGAEERYSRKRRAAFCRPKTLRLVRAKIRPSRARSRIAIRKSMIKNAGNCSRVAKRLFVFKSD